MCQATRCNVDARLYYWTKKMHFRHVCSVAWPSHCLLIVCCRYSSEHDLHSATFIHSWYYAVCSCTLQIDHYNRHTYEQRVSGIATLHPTELHEWTEHWAFSIMTLTHQHVHCALTTHAHQFSFFGFHSQKYYFIKHHFTCIIVFDVAKNVDDDEHKNHKNCVYKIYIMCSKSLENKYIFNYFQESVIIGQ